jgi:RHS repeat-associated protein
VLWERWKDDGQGGFTDYEKLALREFRYHPNPRGRFMVRDLKADDEFQEWQTVGAERWTDYHRAMPHGDFDVTFDPNGVPGTTETTRYLEGFGLPAQQTVSTGETRYLHGDLVRSTNLLTDGNGAAVATSAYTAFGELVGGDLDTRYRYAGGWGYETAGFADDPGLLVLEGAPGSAPITLMHVGHRWYQPDIGRFIQRDPLGIGAGVNVYTYGHNAPTITVDPDGQFILILTGGLVAGGLIVKGIHDMYWDMWKASRVAEIENRMRRRNPYRRPSLRPIGLCIESWATAPGTSVGFGPPGIPTDKPGAIGVFVEEAVKRSGALDPPEDVISDPAEVFLPPLDP